MQPSPHTLCLLAGRGQSPVLIFTPTKIPTTSSCSFTLTSTNTTTVTTITTIASNLTTFSNTNTTITSFTTTINSTTNAVATTTVASAIYHNATIITTFLSTTTATTVIPYFGTTVCTKTTFAAIIELLTLLPRQIQLSINTTEHIGLVVRTSVSGYSGRLLKSRHLYVVSLSKTLYLHCFSRLSYEMSTRWRRPRDGCSVL